MTCLRGLTALSALAVVSVKGLVGVQIFNYYPSTRYCLPKSASIHALHLKSRQKRPSPEARIGHEYVYFVRASAIGTARNIC